MSGLTLAFDLSLACLASLIIGGGIFSSARRYLQDMARLRQTVTTQAVELAAVQRDLTALLTCARRLGERVGQGERTQRALQKQLDQVLASDDQHVAVQHAIKLLTSGLDLKNVTSICELSEGEVEILQNLARHQHAA